MNKRILVTTMFALGGGLALALPAFAQNSPDTSQPPQVAAASNPKPVAASAKQDGKRAVPPVDSRMCVRDTGSHIPPPKGQCLPVAGNSYSQQDIQRTGANNVGQALQMLDPSVQIRGGGH
jgi:hypothetical protein